MSRAVAILGLVAACGGTASEPDPAPALAPPPPQHVPRAWRYYHVDLDEAYTADPRSAAVRSDGRIVLHHVLEDDDLTVDAPAELLAEIDAVAAAGFSMKTPGGIVYADAARTGAGAGPPDPARERRIVERVRALARQSPRLVPCPKLESTATAFGVRVVWSKGGRPHEVFEYSAERDEAISKALAPASRSDHPDIPPAPARGFLSRADIERLRAAVLELDLGRHTGPPTAAAPYVDVELTFPYRPFDGCGRRFAPGLPAAGKSLEAAVDAIVATLWKPTGSSPAP